MGDATPGCYFDPSGEPGNQYRDGRKWRGGTTPLAEPRKSRRGLSVALAVVAVPLAFVVGFMTMRSALGDDVNFRSHTANVIATCQNAVRESLRDPGSARFSEWIARKSDGGRPPSNMEIGTDDELYLASGSVDAKNGFGGYAEDLYYTCTAVVSEDGQIHARAASAPDLPCHERRPTC
ncbi:hypothetical protein [Mycobacterium sp. PSTR-4-N]|uniref:hypothetical protein n=1 Tax=Mycobacterium sp. PSTR-4-N TaxID=2917745 RepID=UPI001F14C355|nr:hypothetical protein [Mycobacterium sp. PSTR-4-N]MCG7593726.1 hypothetical protein [Mycobacterium sp. PSTR-4-N]